MILKIIVIQLRVSTLNVIKINILKKTKPNYHGNKLIEEYHLYRHEDLIEQDVLKVEFNLIRLVLIINVYTRT